MVDTGVWSGMGLDRCFWLSDEQFERIKHHNPLSDAHACGLLWLWLISDFKASHEQALNRQARNDKKLTFTGTLSSYD